MDYDTWLVQQADDHYDSGYSYSEIEEVMDAFDIDEEEAIQYLQENR